MGHSGRQTYWGRLAEFLLGAGVMRGAGRQLLASILNLITYWVLGLPLAILLGVYFNLGVEGLWWALLITTTVQVSPNTLAEQSAMCEGIRDAK